MGHTLLRPVRIEDAEALRDIYAPYVGNSAISFEEETPSPEEMRARIGRVSAAYPWLVCEEAGRVIGYAYASKWKERAAYRFTAETTVYVAGGATGRGIGSLLLGGLVAELRRGDTHALIAVIALPNEPSVRLHERFGYRKAAHFHEVGRKFGRWIDVGYWERPLPEPGATAGGSHA